MMKKATPPDGKQRTISAFFAPRPGAQAKPATAKKPAVVSSDAQENNCPVPTTKPAAPPGPASGTAAPALDKEQPAGTPQAEGGSTTPPPASSRQPLTPTVVNASAGISSKQEAAAPAAPEASPTASGQHPRGAQLVGWSLQVYWPLDVAWYKGRIIGWDGEQYRVEYEDGEEEYMKLESQRYRLLAPPPGGQAAATAAGGSSGRQAKRRRAVLESSEEEEEVDDDADSDYGADQEAAGSEDEAEDEQLGDEMDDEEEEEEEEEQPKASSKRRKTGAGAAAARGKRGTQPASSAGHTPMDQAAPGARAGGGSSSVPGGRGAAPPSPVGFPGFTPPRQRTPEEGASPRMLGERPVTDLADGCDVTPTPGLVTPSEVLDSLSGRAGPRSKARLSGALDVTPSSSSGAGLAGRSGSNGGVRPLPDVVLGVRAHGGAEAARFAARLAERFPFLRADRIKDAAGRRPDHASYDPTTLYIPPGWAKEQKVTEAQQQWWEFKASNFDSVLLFKVGKFYEMFEMDSYVAVDVLGLSFMKGDQPHAGFPEASYTSMAEQLARAGYRVVVVEQTETPEMLAERNRERKAAKLKAASVVRREAVAVLSPATLTDPAMTLAQPDAAWVLAVVEVPAGGNEGGATEGEEGGSAPPLPLLGVCALDAAGGQVLVGAWRDDEVRLGLRQVLAALSPGELVVARGGASPGLATLLRGGAPGAAWNQLAGLAEASDPAAAAKAIRSCKHFPDGAPPALLQQLLAAHAAGTTTEGVAPMEVDGASSDAAGWQGGAEEAGAALCASGLLLGFLSRNLLTDVVLPGATFSRLQQQGSAAAGSDPAAVGVGSRPLDASPTYMTLDGAALENLEVLSNSAGGSVGSLAGLLDHTSSPWGRRRLRGWLARPLARVADICARQDAVEELMGPLCEAAGAARRALAGVSDLERGLARLAARARCEAGGVGREAPHVVLYEDMSKRRVGQLVGAVKDLGALGRALAALAEASPSSALLAGLVDPGRWQPLGTALEELGAATDWEEAGSSGTITPRRGGDAAHDAAEDAVAAATAALKTYLGEVRKELRCSSISYVSCNKDTHLLEVPEATKVPSEYALAGQRKGFKRYTTPDLGELVADHAAAQQQLEEARSGLLLALERRFMSHRTTWFAAVEAVAQLDALMALAGAGLAAEGPLCRPAVVEPQPGAGPFFHALQLRHPAGLTGVSGCFVPNNITLGAPPADVTGGEEGSSGARFLVLTGPNMGGKSTLLRQVCLAAILAQVGAWVPAESLTLTAMDGVYVRMGARDAILSGQSTFYVELAETGALLRRATTRSLVVLDELGRGTATLDGAAIAAAVLDQLAHQVGCCGLLATHYHQLAAAHAADPAVALMHMACAVSGSSEDREATTGVDAGGAPCTPGPGGSGGGSDSRVVAAEEVTFLYKLTPGACPKSYGTNVARLAGLPASVVARAAAISAQREDKGSSSSSSGSLLAALSSIVAQLKPLQGQQQPGDAAGDSGPGTPAAAAQSVPWRLLQQQAQQVAC